MFQCTSSNNNDLKNDLRPLDTVKKLGLQAPYLLENRLIVRRTVNFAKKTITPKIAQNAITLNKENVSFLNMPGVFCV